jgi:predicted O-methyltransferase YrrM
MVNVMAKNVAAVKTLINEKEDYQNKLLNINYSEHLMKMQEYALENDVPIMQDEGIAFLIMLLNVKKPKRILEIGSAIGFSSSVMALNSDAIIDTMERDSKMIAECKKNHEILGLTDRINLIEGDALVTIEEVKSNKYDFIFIDAAKAQYIKFFEMYSELLANDGVILSDNLYFHDLLFTEVNNRDLRQLVRKVGKYNEYLLNHPTFETHIFKMGDGVGVSTRKK